MKVTTVQVLIGDRCPASGIFTIVDSLMAANYSFRKSSGVKHDIFSFRLVGRKTEHHAYNGFAISNVELMDVNNRPEILVVPGMMEATANQARLERALSGLDDYIELIRTWHQQGTVIVGACNGNLCVAKAGIAPEKTLTAHWIMESVAKKLFPEQAFDVDQLAIDHGDVISFGGASAAAQMVLYIIERFHSRELALATGKLMLIEPVHDLQTPFSMFMPNRNHDDEYVAQLQMLLEQGFKDIDAMPEVMEKVAMSERQLTRRFKQATGETPIAYLQRVRIEYVRRGLETTNKQVNSLIWESGYEDVSSFRRLFKRTLGITMSEYRQRYGVNQRLAAMH